MRALGCALAAMAAGAPVLAAASEPVPAGVVAAQPAPAAASPATWSLTIGGGPTAQPARSDVRTWPAATVLYLELQRRTASALILGAALDVGPDVLGLRDSAFDLIAGAALVGAGHRWGRNFVEATAGLGLEIYQYTSGVLTKTVHETSSETIVQGVPTMTVAAYLRGQASVGVSLSRSFDLLASAGGHLGSWHSFDGFVATDRFVTTSLGLRFRFE